MLQFHKNQVNQEMHVKVSLKNMQSGKFADGETVELLQSKS
jgi:hypothetical protein